MDPIRLLRPDGLVHSPAFSHVAVVPPGATTVHVGGQNGVGPDGRVVGDGDVGAEVRQLMANLATALAAGGATMTDLVSVTVLLVDGVDIATAYGAAAASLSSDPPPLVTAAVVSALGVPGAQVEVSAVAAVVR